MSLLPKFGEIDFEKMGESAAFWVRPDSEDLKEPEEPKEPEEASKENFDENLEGIDYLNEVMSSIPISELISLAAEEIFADELTQSPELFLTKIIDETELIQSELTAKINWLLESQNISPPEHLVFQVLGREGYLSGKLKEKDGIFGKFMMGLVCGNSQTIVFNKQTHVLGNEEFTPIFELNLDQKKSQIYPTVPKSTRIVYPDGRATIKPKNYRSYLIWMFWADNPKTSKNDSKNGSTRNLDENQLKNLNDELIKQEQESLLHPTNPDNIQNSQNGSQPIARTFSV